VNRKILFVDDDPVALELYKYMLQGDSDIMTAAGGEDGLVIAPQSRPVFAIVVSDMQMGRDGWSGIP